MARSFGTATRLPGSSRSAWSPWAWATLGLLCGVLGAMVYFAPASWVARGVSALSQDRVQLSDSAGTLWSGSARVALTGGQGSADARYLPGRVQWTLGLGWGRLHLGLAADCCTAAPVRVELAPAALPAFWSGWSMQVAASQSTWPAALLTGLGTPWNTVQAQGNLLLATPGFTVRSDLGRISLAGGLQLEAQNLHSRLSTLRPLGSYRIQVQGGEQPTLVLSTLQGSLQLSGQGQWNAGRLRFVGQASAEPAHAQELSNLLNIMGRRDGVRSVITIG